MGNRFVPTTRLNPELSRKGRGSLKTPPPPRHVWSTNATGGVVEESDFYPLENVGNRGNRGQGKPGTGKPGKPGTHGTFLSTNNSATGRSQTYTYDEMNRLKTALSGATSGSDCWGQEFDYDRYANLNTITAGMRKGACAPQPAACFLKN